MSVLKLLVTIISLAIACLGGLGIAAPSVLLELGRSLTAPPALYWVAAVRVLFGALLILVASRTRMPILLRVIGAFIVVAGLLTPLFGADRFRDWLAWVAGQDHMLVRAVAFLALVAGAFFVYAVNSRRHADAA